jgi:hypothetical protein
MVLGGYSVCHCMMYRLVNAFMGPLMIRVVLAMVASCLDHLRVGMVLVRGLDIWTQECCLSCFLCIDAR